MPDVLLRARNGYGETTVLFQFYCIGTAILGQCLNAWQEARIEWHEAGAGGSG